MAYVVPGSEKFEYRPQSSAMLRAKLPASLRLHSVAHDKIEHIDPLTYEVIRHRLWAITDEMGEALKRMSGSVVVTDANDFGCGIMDEIGDLVQVGLYNTELVASMDMAIKWTLENRYDNPGFAEGDMFLCNDPWVGGGIHQNDVSIFAPLFWEGEIFSWTAVIAHQVDLGGTSPGSFAPSSRDVFWESLPTPPVKIVESGRIRADIEDLYIRRSRVPPLIGLDLRAQIGANNVAHEQLRNLIKKYGAESVKAVMQRMMNDAEERLRKKLKVLPDGVWNGVTYQDQSGMGDRNIHKIVLSMTKKDGHLTFDFTGTDPQSGMINCTYAGIRGGIMPIVLPLLCGDIPWSPGGLYRCISIISEEGTLNNCTFPAGICKASVASCWATQNVVTECISGMLDTDPALRANAMAVISGSFDLTLIAGVDQRKHPFVTMLCDAMAGGMGARTDMDGVDTGGLACIPMGRIADVEMSEFAFPILYLWRKEDQDSGGPGRFRGGLGGSSCFIMHDTSTIHMVLSGGGKALPQSSGLSGGYPGSTMHDLILRESNVRDLLSAGRIPSSLAEVKGTQQIIQPEDESDLSWNDIFYAQWQAGGGYGDPLLRSPKAVSYDLAEEKISLRSAQEIYGVTFNAEGLVDTELTELRRVQLRKERAGVA